MRTVTETGLNISRGSYLCSESTVEIDTKWGGFKNLAGSEGGFLIHASGCAARSSSGCFGAIEKVTLAPGERLVLDTGHMVAYEPSVQMTLRKATDRASIQTLKSGEGFVFEFTGPGDIWTQTRSPSALVRWLTTALPFSRAMIELVLDRPSRSCSAGADADLISFGAFAARPTSHASRTARDPCSSASSHGTRIAREPDGLVPRTRVACRDGRRDGVIRHDP